MPKYQYLIVLIVTQFFCQFAVLAHKEPSNHTQSSHVQDKGIHPHHSHKGGAHVAHTHSHAPPEAGHTEDHCCHAHTHHAHVHSHEDSPSSSVVRLLNIFHMAVDGEHVHFHSAREFFKAYQTPQQWKKFLENLNFVEVGTRALRAYNMESDQQDLKDHAKNLVFIYPFSHGLEVMAAPLFVTLGTLGDWPASVVAGGGALLSVIALPGLDPLCMLIIATYPLQPVHKTINFLRSHFERGLRGSIQFLGIQGWRDRHLSYRDPAEFLQEVLNSLESRPQTYSLHLEVVEEKVFLKIYETPKDHGIEGAHEVQKVNVGQSDQEFHKVPEIYGSHEARDHENHGNHELLTLQFHRQLDEVEKHKTRVYLSEIKFHDSAVDRQMHISFLQAVAPLFSWNVRRALKEVERALEDGQYGELERKFYVQGLVRDDGLKIQFRPKAIHWNPQKLWSTGKQSAKNKMAEKLANCQQALASH